MRSNASKPADESDQRRQFEASNPQQSQQGGRMQSQPVQAQGHHAGEGEDDGYEVPVQQHLEKPRRYPRKKPADRNGTH
ncbi:MAG TPA: hypothetical protein VER17_06870 [Tepidisphaeraceae bacterium]|nr:hypothetical protein [Tepidisphaeraceae bacterium]